MRVEALTSACFSPYFTVVTGTADFELHDVTGPTDVTVVLDGHDYRGG